MNAASEATLSPPRGALNHAAPPPLRVLLDMIDRLGRLDGWLGSGCLLSLTLLMLTEIALRLLSHFFSSIPASLAITWEYSSYLMAATFTFGAAMTLRADGHIRVTLLVRKLPASATRALEFIASLCALGFMTFLTWAMVRFTMNSYARSLTSVISETPLWVPQTMVTIGLVLLDLQLLARCIHAVLGLPLKDHHLRPVPPE